MSRAQRLVVVSVGALGSEAAREADEVVARFANQGVAAELETLQSRGSAADALAAVADEVDAKLVVMGAYGRWRLRQLVLGSCTEDALRCIDRTILLMH